MFRWTGFLFLFAYNNLRLRYHLACLASQLRLAATRLVPKIAKWTMELEEGGSSSGSSSGGGRARRRKPTPVTAAERRSSSVRRAARARETAQVDSNGGFHAEAQSRPKGWYASSSEDELYAANANDEDDANECDTPRAGSSRAARIRKRDGSSTTSPISLSSSTASSRYYGSSNTSPASPVAVESARKPLNSGTSRSGSPTFPDEDDFVTRVRAGLQPSSSSGHTPGRSKPFPTTSSPKSGSTRRTPRTSTTPRTSRPSTRRHSRRNSDSSPQTSLPFPRSPPTLSPEAVQQIISVSLYTLVTIVAGVALVSILAGSYALSIGDDLKDRLIEAKLSATEAVELAKQEALKVKVTLEKRVKQVGDSWNIPATEQDRPDYRQLFGHVYQQVTPPFIYAFSVSLRQPLLGLRKIRS